VEKIIVYTHSDCLAKDNGPNHPERKERLETVLDSVKELDSLDIDIREAPLAAPETINLVHPQSHLNAIFSMIPSTGLVGVEKEPYADTFLCEHSKDAILRSCGAGIAAADDLINSNEKRIFCAVRPPGHHAEKQKAMGFCVYNNIAVGAYYLLEKYNLKKVAIIDFDVHHGNGTQDIFYDNERVLYISSHQYPYYPGSGAANEKGNKDNVLNVPLNAGTQSHEFLNAYESIFKKLKEFKPEFILLSAGFDAHKNDPLAQINLESKDYYTLTKRILSISRELCSGKVVSILEGGYDLNALKESVDYHVKSLMEDQ